LRRKERGDITKRKPVFTTDERVQYYGFAIYRATAKGQLSKYFGNLV